MKKTLIGTVAAVTLGVTGALAFVTAAQAAPGDDFWVANDGSNIVNGSTVELTGNNTSVETTKAFPELTVAKDSVLSFKYTLADGAKCIGGGPRVFVVIDGTNVNTWDQNIPNGVEAACEGEAVLPAGKVTAAGVVYDNSVGGTVTVSDVKIGDTAVNFKAYEIETLTEVKAPSQSEAQEPTCTTVGTYTKAEQTGVKYNETVEDGKFKVTAEPVFGYKFAENVMTTWTFPVAKLTGEQCETSPSPSPSPSTPPADVEITPAAPKIGKVTCDQFELLTDEHDGLLNWNVADTKVNGDTVTIKVVVTADKGYVVKGQTEWDLSFKIPANCTATPAPTEVPTSPAAGGQLPVTGPGGGANVPLIGGLAGSALLAFGIALFVWAKRRRDNEVEFTA